MSVMRRRLVPLAAILVAPFGAGAQYVGKVTTAAAPPLRAVSVYEYTGQMTKPNASRLVPVVVWDGTNFQPGGLYKAEPEPLAVAPGTQYVLTPGGVPGGMFNVLSSAQLDGGWVGLGRYEAPASPAPVKTLRASKNLPVLHGGSLHANPEHVGNASSGSGGPVLHRKPGSETGTDAGSGTNTGTNTSSGTSSGTSTDTGTGPTLHRRDDTASSSSASSPSAAPAEDPDRPRLHEGSPSSSASAAEPDRPLLHRRTGGSMTAEGAPPPDPGRPRLRYGTAEDADTLVLPTLLKPPPRDMAGAPVVPIGQVVAISDVSDDEPHPFAHAWPSEAAKADAEAAMHTLALAALASVVQASFGPAAAKDASLQHAADAAQSGFGPAAARRARTAHKTSSAPDPLLDPAFHAFELSYGGGVTLVYSAHTAAEGAARRFVLVIAQLNFEGAPQKVFARTTRGDMLAQVPALHLIDAVDVKGDHRAELLFDERTSDSPVAPRDRQFALYSVYGGQASEVYSGGPGTSQ